MKQIACFDFGNVTVPVATGYIKVDRVYRSSRYLWVNEVENKWRPCDEECPLKDFVTGDLAEFRIGIPAGEYRLHFKFFDSFEDYGPFRISLCDLKYSKSPLGSGNAHTETDYFIVKKGQLLIKNINVKHNDKVLVVRFEATKGNCFMINALEIEGPETAQLEVLFPDAPFDTLPSMIELENEAEGNPEHTLKKICEWLLKSRSRDGFLGDFESGNKAWYTSAYPMRALLAGYEILNNDSFLAPVFDILDALISEQMPCGGFVNVFRNRPTKYLSEIEIDNIKNRHWMNLADIGSIVATLVSASRFAGPERKVKYLSAAEEYCNRWAIRFLHPEGGFDNGWLAGKYAKKIYSVATATTALTYAFLSKVTNNSEYILTAEKACGFLAEGWNDDGRPLAYPFDGEYPDKPYYKQAIEFGDIYYYLEGMMGTALLSNNKNLRKLVLVSLQKYIFGREGILEAKKGLSWWSLMDAWTNSKSVAIPIFLINFIKLENELKASVDQIEQIKKEYELCKKFLCTPKFSKLLGVNVNDPVDVPWGNHGMSSWTACSICATGFAGMSVAEMIKPGIVFMKS